MPDEVTPERVAAIAAAARVPLEQTSAARVANAVNPTVTRFAAQRIALPLEVEPATYAVVARQGYQAWRKNVTGIVQGPLPFFWGVSKTV